MPDDVPDDGPILSGPADESGDNAADGSSDTGNPEKQLAQFLRRFFTEEILPALHQAQNQVLDARLTEIRTWVSQQITPLAPQPPPNPQVLSQQVGEILLPEFNRVLTQGVEPIAQRLLALEARTVSEPGAQMRQAGSAAVADEAPASLPDRLTGIAALADTLMDMFTQKVLPAWSQMQQMKQTNKLVSMDPKAIEEFRKAFPIAAMMLGQQFAPDQNMMGLLNQLPYITANAIGVGMKARQLAPQIIAPGGGAAWPGTPGSGLPGFSPSPPGGPSPAPIGPRTGASMQNRRPRPSRNGRTGFLSLRTMPISGAERQAPKRLSDLLER